MQKISIPLSNRFCPQTLFLYGTYDNGQNPDFGLFCWFSYCWDAELQVMCCIGGEKLTKDRIRESKVFSANLVTQPLLPLADYLGSNEGYKADKMNRPVRIEQGRKLSVPVLTDSPWVYELEAVRTLPLDDGDVFLCKIHNVLADEVLLDENESIAQRMAHAAPVMATGTQHYFAINPNPLGQWGQWKE